MGAARKRWSVAPIDPQAPLTWRNVRGRRSRQLLRNAEHTDSVHWFVAPLSRQARSHVEAYGSVDVVLNSAGIISDLAVLGDAVPEDRFERTAALYDRVLEVNLRGTYLICWLAIQQMRENSGGSIINISSINGVVGAPIGLGSGFDPYVPSKGGVVQLTKNLAIQYGRDSIRVNCICPGHVRTNLIRSITDNPQITERLEERYPLGRFAEPEEIANAALFLASDESSFVTGAPMLVDGGYTAL